jgi:hypothetical protein
MASFSSFALQFYFVILIGIKRKMIDIGGKNVEKR